MRCQSRFRLVSVVARKFGTTSRACASHYDVLGITPKANQSDIKSAYYKLSKIYHPDKSPDEESAKKFRSITEAYEVLGNVKLKKMYDKGLLVGREKRSHTQYRHEEEETTDPTLKFYKSHSFRNVVPTMDGKKPIYDFDAWSKNHYSDLLSRARHERDFIKNKQVKQINKIETRQQEAFLYLMFAITGLFIILVANGTSDYDKDMTLKKQTQKDDNKDAIKS